MKPRHYRLLILLALFITGISWFLAESIGILFLPFIAGPAYLLSAFTTRFMVIKNLLIRIPLVVIAILATAYAFAITASGLSSTTSGLFATETVTPPEARFAALIATIVYGFAQLGLWGNYFKRR
jgi:hypothetical protein